MDLAPCTKSEIKNIEVHSMGKGRGLRVRGGFNIKGDSYELNLEFIWNFIKIIVLFCILILLINFIS